MILAIMSGVFFMKVVEIIKGRFDRDAFKQRLKTLT